MEGTEGASIDLQSVVSPNSQLEAVILIKRTGTLLGAWRRGDVPLDVISAMAATLVGSVEVMVEATRRRSPESVRIECGECLQIMTQKVNSHAVLVAMAPNTVRPADFRQEVQQIATGLEWVATRHRRPAPAPALAGAPPPLPVPLPRAAAPSWRQRSNSGMR